jgi:phytoene dehydrogenase-like protein
MSTPDAVVVGAGPNGLAAAVTLARAGLSVTVYEGAETIGGGARTAELTLPGFHHDVCSAVHPMAFASQFFREFKLEKRIELVVPELSYGHPLDGGRAGLAWHDLDRTADGLGVDGPAWRGLFAWLARHADDVAQFAGGPLLRVPKHPFAALNFGLRALEQGSPAWNLRFTQDVAPAMLTGVAAHSILPLPSLSTAGAGLSLATYAHARGWPVPVGGSQSIVDALAADLIAHGGTIVTGTTITELPEATAVIFTTNTKGLASIAGDQLPARYLKTLDRYQYGNAVAKVDFALDGPVPWTNADLASAGTLHVGGTRAEIARGEKDVANGDHPESPYVLVAQPSAVDASRAPEGKHVLWAYTHVPRNSTFDATEAITAQIERFAPGFRDRILASAHRTAVDMSNYNPNYVGGDIAAGAATFGQLLARPIASPDPWRTPAKGIYLGSSSATPGPGVHGLGGWNAAKSALKHEFGLDAPDLSRPN